MIEIDLTTFELFRSFTEIKSENLYIDLHNDFDCHSISYSRSSSELILSFKANKQISPDVKRVEVIFNECSIESYELKNENDNLFTIDHMHRGRFEKDNIMCEVPTDEAFFYSIIFYSDSSLELFAKKVTAIIS
jgi:hypothetical protein